MSSSLLIMLSVVLACSAAIGVASIFFLLRKRKQNSVGGGVVGQPLITEESLCGQTLHDIIEMTTSGELFLLNNFIKIMKFILQVLARLDFPYSFNDQLHVKFNLRKSLEMDVLDKFGLVVGVARRLQLKFSPHVRNARGHVKLKSIKHPCSVMTIFSVLLRLITRTMAHGHNYGSSQTTMRMARSLTS